MNFDRLQDYGCRHSGTTREIHCLGLSDQEGLAV